MHIKSLKIQGFKSYRDETIVDPFSPGLNLLVGRNGSGKSNFFSAIRFVLSDAYSGISREERQSLLHDGSLGAGGGGATMSAFVEIEFDNADGRFPTNKPTLLIRRTIGLKKDEFQLDRKSAQKTEVMSLLESAGFSRSNPYYIVPQGRVTHLTNQKDGDRLQLLKEVAGTKVYEERRAESTKIMDETNAKRAKIDGLLKVINDRLSELEEEKEELKSFHQKDRQRRSYEYTLYQKELKEVADALDNIEEDRRRDADEANTRRSQFQDRDEELNSLAAQLDEKRQQVEVLAIDHRQTSADRREAVQEKARVECLIRDGEEADRLGQDKLTRLNAQLGEVERQIAAKQAELMAAEPDYADQVKQQTEADERLNRIETALHNLHAKQGRQNQFTTRAERDAHLAQEIERTKQFITVRGDNERRFEAEIATAEHEVDELAERQTAARGELESRRDALQRLAREVSELNAAQHDGQEKRKELWKEDAKLTAQVRHAQEQLKESERRLWTTMDRDTAAGLKSCEAIADRLGLKGNGYHGPLYSLFKVDDRYKTAVEVTAGSSLFQVVVDNDEVATQILDVMLREKSGRLTFVPLNRLNPDRQEYPSAKEAIAMIKKLEFDQRYAKAFEHVFGKTIICQTLDIAGAYTKSHNLNAITLEGDKYDRRGLLTGGYHDTRRSRLDAIKAVKNWQSAYDDLRSQQREINQELARLDQQITQRVGQLQVAEGKLNATRDERQPLVQSLLSLQADEDKLKTRLSKLERELGATRNNVANLESEQRALEAERNSPMEQHLSDEEIAQMASLSEELDRTRKLLVQLSSTVTEAATRKMTLETDLNENLRRRREELKTKIDSFDENADADLDGEVENVAARRRQLDSLTDAIDALTTKLDQIAADTERLRTEIAKGEQEREAKEQQQLEDGRSIGKQQKSVERYLAKRQLLIGRKDECNKNIRDLGVLPDAAFDEANANTSSERLMKRLKRVNEELKQYSHVNKKAFEQYTSFTKQRDELHARQAELDASATSITDLIDVLDARKDEAIERTFKQVAKNFAEVFEKLVPAGRGRLIMQRREHRTADDMDVDDDDSDRDEGSVENYTGVAIRVSFNSKSNEGLRIQQLSGGQKALVALAIIFAIQKCDPAPFYLFDEIDANLDADRRTAVAAMVAELAQGGQYICTTFRPELIQHAEAFFGVTFGANKVSKVSNISAEDCQRFIEAADTAR